MVLVANGRYEEGIAEITRAIALSPSTQIKAFLGYSYAVAGHRSEAQQILSELTSLPEQQYVAPDNLARICVGLGETDRAFEWLKQAYQDRGGWMAYLLVDPTFDPLRSDPRFQALLHKMNFPAQG